ncbi:MAG: hypothetical protein Q9187_000326 [Circinaria calcarea]
MEQQIARLQQELEQERRRREEAEESSRLTTLLEYLKICHESFNAPTVVTEKSLTTQGDTTDPDNIHSGQLLTHLEFLSLRQFPSSNNVEYLRETLGPISSEDGVVRYGSSMIEIPVRTLIEAVYEAKLPDAFSLPGKVVFQSHSNLAQGSGKTIKEGIEQMSITGPSTPIQTRGKTREQGRGADKGTGVVKQSDSKSSVRRRAGMSDRFCILEADRGQATIMMTEYKPPHKFSLDNIIAGLQSGGEICPAKDIIGEEGTSFEFQSKCLVVAVITQLFSDMIRKGLRWGYVCTVEANIFLHIPDHPSDVYYHISIPKIDYEKAKENSLHRVAVAEVFAFVMRAMRNEAPNQLWRDEAEKLPTWPNERIDILKDIPPTPGVSDVEGSDYKSKYVDAYCSSPIILRPRKQLPACKEAENDTFHRGDRDGHDDGDEEVPSMPRPAQGNSQGMRGSQNAAPKGRASSETTSGTGKYNDGGRKRIEAMSRPRIEDRPYCTHSCLLGLAFGGAMDKQCPNIQDHPKQHINQENFLRLVRDQLATDRGSDADCKPLGIKGARGALFKVRLSSHGYIVAAKGVESHNLRYLQHEHNIYKNLCSIQGELIPVCLGSAALRLPWYYDIGRYVNMLFLSWAGRPLMNYLDHSNKELFIDATTRALESLHNLKVLHRDAELRNILLDGQSRRLMFVDFERAELLARQPLGSISPNRKRKLSEGKQTVKKDDFSLEIRRASECISSYVSSK